MGCGGGLTVSQRVPVETVKEGMHLEVADAVLPEPLVSGRDQLTDHVPRVLGHHHLVIVKETQVTLQHTNSRSILVNTDSLIMDI